MVGVVYFTGRRVMILEMDPVGARSCVFSSAHPSSSTPSSSLEPVTAGLVTKTSGIMMEDKLDLREDCVPEHFKITFSPKMIKWYT